MEALPRGRDGFRSGVTALKTVVKLPGKRPPLFPSLLPVGLCLLFVLFDLACGYPLMFCFGSHI